MAKVTVCDGILFHYLTLGGGGEGGLNLFSLELLQVDAVLIHNNTYSICVVLGCANLVTSMILQQKFQEFGPS